MADIRIKVQGEIATNLTPNVKLVCQNDKYEVEFEFDESWANSNFKTALFIYNGKSIAVPFDREQNGNVCKIPALYDTELLHIGVKSSDVEGLHTSTPARVGCLLSANDIANGEIPNPTPSQYDEIIALLNQYITGGGEPIDLKDYQKKVDDRLETTDKTIVGAINEVNEKASQPSGGGLTEEEVKEIVQETAITKESDPTVPEWAKQEEKPTYTYEEITEKPDLVEDIGSSIAEETNVLTIELKDKSGKVIATTQVTIPTGETPDLSAYVKTEDRDSFVQQGVVNNSLTNTDEEKASACKWLGAVQRKPTTGATYAYCENPSGLYQMLTDAVAAKAWSLAQRGAGGVLVVGNPTADTHATPKGWIVNMPDYVTDETIKAKWRAWLGI
jgi:hypothetical protein